MSEKRRWKEIDVLYTIGICLVIIGHSHSNDWDSFSGTVLEKAISFIYTFHMPLFFFIAGFLFWNSERIEGDGIIVWIKNKAIRLLTPYTFWITMASLPKYYLENGTFRGFSFSYLLNALMIPTRGILKYFWFIQVLFLSYFFFGLLRTSLKDKRAFFFISTLCAFVLYFIPIHSEVLSFNELKSLMIFFTIGALFNEIPRKPVWNVVSVTSSFVAFAASTLLTDINQIYRNNVVSLFVALMMIAVCWVVATKISASEVISQISQYNFTIYIFSWLFQAIVMMFCDKIGAHWIVTASLMIVTGFLGPMFVIFCYRKLLCLHKGFIRLVLGIR